MATGRLPAHTSHKQPPRDHAKSRPKDMRHVCKTICRLSAEAEPDLTRVARIVDTVPQLRARVFQQVDGLRHRLHNPISSVEHAVVYLGAARVRQVVEEELAALERSEAPVLRVDTPVVPGVPGQPHHNLRRTSQSPSDSSPPGPDRP